MKWISNLENIDQKVILLLNGNNNPIIDEIMWMISDPLFGVPFYLFFIYLIYKNYQLRETIWIVILMLVVVGLGDYIAKNFFKETIQRYRPSHNLDITNKLNYYLKSNGDFYKGGAYGFVSNHATNMAAVGGSVFLFLRKQYSKLWVLLFLFVITISYSRIYLGVHYLSDIIGGWILGLTLAQLGYILFNKFKK